MTAVTHVTYKARIELAIPCLVCCKNCGLQFVYERQFIGQGEAGTFLPFGHDRTEESAKKQANRDLNEMLANEEIHDNIPCPDCLHYQPYMFSQVGYRHYDNMGCLCYFLVILGLLVLIGALGFAAIWQASPLVYSLAASGAVVWFIGWLILQRMHKLVLQYNPNAEDAILRDTEERTRTVKARATLLSKYDARQALRVSEEYKNALVSTEKSGTQDRLIFEWWLAPSVFDEGCNICFQLPDGTQYTAVVSDAAHPGDMIDAAPTSPSTKPVRLLLRQMRVHPEEGNRE
jgi:hypothetical protein